MKWEKEINRENPSINNIKFLVYCPFEYPGFFHYEYPFWFCLFLIEITELPFFILLDLLSAN